jgi:hypothetical protein
MQRPRPAAFRVSVCEYRTYSLYMEPACVAICLFLWQAPTALAWQRSLLPNTVVGALHVQLLLQLSLLPLQPIMLCSQSSTVEQRTLLPAPSSSLD